MRPILNPLKREVCQRLSPENGSALRAQIQDYHKCAAGLSTDRRDVRDDDTKRQMKFVASIWNLEADLARVQASTHARIRISGDEIIEPVVAQPSLADTTFHDKDEGSLTASSEPHLLALVLLVRAIDLNWTGDQQIDTQELIRAAREGLQLCDEYKTRTSATSSPVLATS